MIQWILNQFDWERFKYRSTVNRISQTQNRVTLEADIILLLICQYNFFARISDWWPSVLPNNPWWNINIEILGVYKMVSLRLIVIAKRLSLFSQMDFEEMTFAHIRIEREVGKKREREREKDTHPRWDSSAVLKSSPKSLKKNKF